MRAGPAQRRWFDIGGAARAEAGIHGAVALIGDSGVALTPAHWPVESHLIARTRPAILDTLSAAVCGAERAGSAETPGAVCHSKLRLQPAALRANARETDWARIVALYRERPSSCHLQLWSSNRAGGSRNGIWSGSGQLVSADRRAVRSRRYHLLPSVRGDLWQKSAARDEARAEFERAA